MTPGHVRYAFRLARRTPFLAVAVVLTLAAGIAVTTCVFGLVNVAWFQPLPYPDAGRLIAVHESHPRDGYAPLVSLASYERWRQHARLVDAVGAYVEQTFAFGRPGTRAERVRGARVSASLLTLLDAHPVLGRRLHEADERPGAPAVAVVSQRFWRQRLSSSASAVGSSVRLDGVDTTIIGVFPYEFRLFNSGFDVFVPLGPAAASDPDARLASVVGRLAAGATTAAAAAEFRAIAPRDGHATQAGRDEWTPVIRPLADVLWSVARRAYLLLLAVTGLLLLLVCANVSNLLLARSVSRRQEFAVRLALGAGSGGVIRQLLVEGLVLALTSGVLALILCSWLRHLLIAAYPEMVDLQIDSRVFAFISGVSFLVGCGLGFVPALSILRGGGGERAWHQEAASGAGRPHRLGRLLVGGQLAVAATLLIACGLLVKGALDVRSIQPGFATRDLLTAELSLPAATYPSVERRTRFAGAVDQMLLQLPGVEAAAASSSLPLDGGVGTWTIEASGALAPLPGSRLKAARKAVTSGYFRTIGIGPVAGELFRPDESRRVAVVNVSLARSIWGSAHAAVGRSLRLGDGPWWTIAGVVDDVRQVLTSPASPEVYVPLAFETPARLSLLLRTRSSPFNAARPLHTAIQRLDGDLALANVYSMDEIVESYVPAPFVAAFGLLSIAALLLGSMGLYAALAFQVARRTREFGIRSALGADSGRLLRLVVGEGLRLTVAGLIAGTVLSVVVGLALSRAFEGVTAFDPIVLALVGVLLTAVSAGACLLPARRATRAEPAAALRCE